MEQSTTKQTMKTKTKKLDLIEKLILTGGVSICLLTIVGFTAYKTARDTALNKATVSITQQMQNAKM